MPTLGCTHLNETTIIEQWLSNASCSTAHITEGQEQLIFGDDTVVRVAPSSSSQVAFSASLQMRYRNMAPPGALLEEDRTMGHLL